MMRITGNWLRAPGLQAVLAMLKGGGHRAFLVGGVVRNALLGLPVSDIDIATDAPPERVMELALAAGLRPVPTGLAHGTVTVVADHIGHEVTTFRRDIATDGRHATIALSDQIEDDAARRDFTMNALYAKADGTVVDPLGGLADLLARRLRFVGDPVARIREDYLRILRFFRFHALYADPQGGFDPEALAACAALAEGLAGLSRERVGAEMRKLLAAPDPAPALAAMQASGVLARVLPGAQIQALAPLIHAETLAAVAPAALRRLAALGGEAPAEALRLSRPEARALAQLQAALAAPPLAPAAEAFRLGPDAARDLLLLRAVLLADPLAPPCLPAGWQAEVARGASAQFPLRAADLAPLQGPALGQRLGELRALWLQGDLRHDRAALLALAQPDGAPDPHKPA